MRRQTLASRYWRSICKAYWTTTNKQKQSVYIYIYIPVFDILPHGVEMLQPGAVWGMANRRRQGLPGTRVLESLSAVFGRQLNEGV